MKTAPFAAFEWMIAWRYLRARRKEGGISVIAWYALIGVMLGVATLIVVQSVMVGFRDEFTDRILGANAHASIYSTQYDLDTGRSSAIAEYADMRDRVAAIAGVTHAAAVINAQVMASANGRNAGIQVTGTTAEDLRAVPLISTPEYASGSLDAFDQGIALGSGVARELGLRVGDKVKLISPEGAVTPFGTSPRINVYTVTYIFQVGRTDIDRVRAYLPFAEAQRFFNREGVADEIQIFAARPNDIAALRETLSRALGTDYMIWTWQQASGAFLDALDVERRVMFIILSLVVLIAAMNIISGLVMLVKNKGRDIGILRTMGLTQGSIMRIFFICGSLIGVIGTILGVVLGALFATYIHEIQTVVEWISGGSVWNAELRFLTEIPSRLRWADVGAAIGLGLGLSLLITIAPARRAARLSPAEALRYE